MRSARRILKNIFSQTAAEIARQGLSIVYIIYLARTLTPEYYGIIGFAKSLTAILVLLNTLGFEVLGQREIAKNINEIRRYVNSILTMRFALSVILFLILIVIVLFLDKPYLDKIIILVIGTNIFSSAFLLNWVFIGTEKMEIPAFRQLFISLLNFTGIFLLIKSQDDTLLAAIVISFTLLINSGWIIFYYIKLYGKIKFDFNIPFWREILKCAIPIGLSYLIVVINNNLNTLMLGLILTNTETGIFTAAMNILIFIVMPSAIFQNAFFPVISRCETTQDRIKFTEKYALITYFFAAIMILGVFTYSGWIVGLLGEKYLKSRDVLNILLFSSALMYINVFFGGPLLAWKREKIVLLAMLSGGIVNLISNILLIPQYGAKGAAISSVLNEFIVAIGLGTIFFKMLRHTFLFTFFKMLIIAAVSCFAGFYIMKAGVYPLISAVLAFVIYSAINIIFKVVNIKEFISYIKK
jgi:O-antigen/teichoic acid export membrane protein